MRTEQEAFDELTNLCASPGYVHAIAYLSHRDNSVQYSGEMQSEDMQHLFSWSRLIRTEISTLVGLLLKTDIDYRLPTPDVLEEYIKRTEALLAEIHQSMNASFFASLTPEKIKEKGFNPFSNGAALREPIFYGGESAYSFQYRDLSVKRFLKDDGWLKANKGFFIQQAKDVVEAVGRFRDGKMADTIRKMRTKCLEECTFLPAFTFTSQEIATYAGIDSTIVSKVLEAFTVASGERNADFTSLSEFNISNALPLIRTDDSTYILFQIYSLVESLYESPFYWIIADKAYASTGEMHRGQFTEEFAAERLSKVFGEENVHPNVDIFDKAGNKLGEIDVLVLFGDRAILLQAKSKRLTIKAKKGHDGQIKDDFKKSIQDSCDQAYKCANVLGHSSYMLRDPQSREIRLIFELKKIYIVCLVADHYPALSFQSQQFLRHQATEIVSKPLVLDVFALDAMTEMLESPLRLLSYIDRRTEYFGKVLASHESTILSYHLKLNLWLSNENSLLTLMDDVSADLDVAMTVRREGIPGKRTPDGILTRFESTTLGRLIREIEKQPNPAMIDLGYLLLMLSEEAVTKISSAIDELVERARADGQGHDATAPIDPGNTGLTIHCNSDLVEVAGPRLEMHCRMRKYSQRAQRWFGICIRTDNALLRFGLNLDYDWERSDDMDRLTQNLPKGLDPPRTIHTSTEKMGKVGRNDPCPCGSGKKYKKCCI